MKVLVACEYSGVVRDSFLNKGHKAISCDLLPTDVDGPHYQGDVFDVLGFGWDLIIMHPPCTALAVSGNRWYGEGMPYNKERHEAIEWTMYLWSFAKMNATRVAMENPVGVLPIKPSQYIQPWQFGHPETKKTGLWLHNLPAIEETNNVYDEMIGLPKKERSRIHHMSPSSDRGKLRSITYKGIAEAMADQWGSLN